MAKTDLHLYFESAVEEQKYLVKNESGVTEYLTQTEGGLQVLGLMVKATKVDKEKYTNYHENGKMHDFFEF